VKSYNRGLHAEDRAAWRAMTEREPVRPQSLWEAQRDFEGSVYYRELLMPLNMRHAVVLPLASPILEGYPGVVYVGRTADEGDFKAHDIQQLQSVIRDFNERVQAARAGGIQLAYEVSKAGVNRLTGEASEARNWYGPASVRSAARAVPEQFPLLSQVRYPFAGKFGS